MTAPLDFTSTARKKTPPPAKPPPPRPPLVSKAGLVVAAAVVAVGGTVLALALSRGGGSQNRATGPSKAAIGAVTSARYCDLAKQFEGLVPISAAPDASGAATVFRVMGATVDEMRSDAPALLSGEVTVVVADLRRAAAGDASAVRAPTYLPARQRLSAFQHTMCNYGTGTNDK